MPGKLNVIIATSMVADVRWCKSNRDPSEPNSLRPWLEVGDVGGAVVWWVAVGVDAILVCLAIGAGSPGPSYMHSLDWSSCMVCISLIMAHIANV